MSHKENKDDDFLSQKEEGIENMESLYHQNQRAVNNEQSIRSISLLEPFNLPEYFRFPSPDWNQDCRLGKKFSLSSEDFEKKCF